MKGRRISSEGYIKSGEDKPKSKRATAADLSRTEKKTVISL